jgi:FMN phosphatase YigB (HAD superfamily)
MQKITKPIIAVDCDHVVVDINEGIRRFVNEAYGETHTPEDYHVTGEYKRYWERVWGLDDGVKSDRFARFVASGGMANLDEIPDCLATLASLRRNYRLAMVTARTQSEVDSTHRWLAERSPGLFDQVVFMHEWNADTEPTKAKICQALGAEYLIDDNYEHCRLASEVGIGTLLFGDYGWNRQVAVANNMYRVKDWREVKEFFDGRQ